MTRAASLSSSVTEALGAISGTDGNLVSLGRIAEGKGRILRKKNVNTTRNPAREKQTMNVAQISKRGYKHTMMNMKGYL